MSDVRAERIRLTQARVDRVVSNGAMMAMRRGMLIVESEWKQRATRSRRTGHYMRSITSRVERTGNVVVGQVGSNVPYARFLEYGTGLYGPRNRWIVPKRAKALRFPQPGNKGFSLAGRQRQGRAGAQARWVYAKRTRGMRPRRFARDAALTSRPRVRAELVAGGQRIAQDLQTLVGRAS